MPATIPMLNIFIAFSPQDQVLKSELEEHLSILQRNGKIDLWHSQRIMAGENMSQAQAQALQNAQIILLLISSDFLASDDAYQNEVLKALERHNNGEARVIPVILRPCLWQNTQLGALSALPTDGKPVVEWQNQDAAFNNIATQIDKLVNQFTYQNNKWIYNPPIPLTSPTTGSPTTAAKTKLIAGIAALVIGLAYTLFAFYHNNNENANDRYKILPLIQGTWMNPNPNDNFIHKITFAENRLKVYSLGQSELIYWGEQELELLTKNKCRAHYPDFSFDLELQRSSLKDTLLESIIAIYQANPGAEAPFKNSKLFKEETLELIAMHPVKNQQKIIDDSLTLVIRNAKEVNMEELNLTPRMIIDINPNATAADTALTRIKNTVVQEAIQRKAALTPPDTLLNTPRPNPATTDTQSINPKPKPKPDTTIIKQIKRPLRTTPPKHQQR